MAPSNQFKSYPHRLSQLSYLLLVLAVALTGCQPQSEQTSTVTDSAIDTKPIETSPYVERGNEEDKATPTASVSCNNDLIIESYTTQRSSVQVKGCGVVKVVLPNDNEGSRHQRFIVNLEGSQPQQTILIAHNIDLAPEITTLKSGDKVAFYGEYEYNERGGVVHWTHHDPAARHQGGWIEHKGQRFE